jgi:pimeloyl-ACP methyl ester carboxylesterase
VSDLYIETWGSGTRVVLVHGSLATGAEEWQAQRPLGDERCQLLVFDRRGYGNSPRADGEDFLRDADDIAELMGDGAHLVGHSYGGLGVLFAAARRPEATLSITLLEAATFTLGRYNPAARALLTGIRDLWDQDLPDDEWAIRFLTAIGSDPSTFGPEFLAAAVPVVPVFRRGRAPWDATLPLAQLAAATFPKLIVSGGHSEALDAMCDDLAQQIGGVRRTIAGAGHEVQFTGQPLNDALLTLWRSAQAT